MAGDRADPGRSHRFGAHMPTQGGLHQAFYAGREVGCEVLQLFTSSPQQWKPREITDEVAALFHAAQEETGIPCVAAHDNYLINPAAQDGEILQKSRQSLLGEAQRCDQLGIPFVVMHLGATASAPEEVAIGILIESVRLVLEGTPPTGPCLLLETTAGQGTTLGYTFEQVARVLEGVGCAERMGVCLDTCHIFAAGYDIRTPDAYAATMDRFDALIGLERLRLIHANDSRRELGSRIDRHQHIGLGELGEDAFRHLLNDPRLSAVPVVLETPKVGNMDPVNLAALRRLAGIPARKSRSSRRRGSSPRAGSRRPP
jgi:deoxyribonuclease-4